MEDKTLLYIDFDGTLCFDRFWRSLGVPQYQKVQQVLFQDNAAMVDDWMRGKYTSEEINHFLAPKIGQSFETLWELFVHDCETMHVDDELLDMINTLREGFYTILITDNMDCFDRFTVPALRLDRFFDRVHNSYTTGAMKADHGGAVFTRYAAEYGTPMERAVLIDNSQSACAIFEQRGGTSYLVDGQNDLYFHLRNL